MGLFGHWSKKRDRQDEERLKDFGAMLDRLEEKLREEQQPEPEKPGEQENQQ